MRLSSRLKVIWVCQSRCHWPLNGSLKCRGVCISTHSWIRDKFFSVTLFRDRPSISTRSWYSSASREIALAFSSNRSCIKKNHFWGQGLGKCTSTSQIYSLYETKLYSEEQVFFFHFNRWQKNWKRQGESTQWETKFLMEEQWHVCPCINTFSYTFTWYV